MEAVTTRERENFMKNKKISKVVLSILTSMSMLSSYSATIFAETPSQETGVAHEHDLIELERKSDLITNGGFDNNGGSWKKTGSFPNKKILRNNLCLPACNKKQYHSVLYKILNS